MRNTIIKDENMNKKLLLLLAIPVTLAASCINKTADTVAPVAPDGTFTGQFMRLRKRVVNAAVKTDTLKTNLTLTVSSNGYTYKITSDTTIHSGSNGTYLYDANGYIRFNDATAPNLISEPVKPHLAGTYQYGYNSTRFIIQRAYSDTLIFRYDLTRVP